MRPPCDSCDALEDKLETQLDKLEILRAELRRIRPVYQAAIQDDRIYGPQGEADRKRDQLCRAIDTALADIDAATEGKP